MDLVPARETLTIVGLVFGNLRELVFVEEEELD